VASEKTGEKNGDTHDIPILSNRGEKRSPKYRRECCEFAQKVPGTHI